MRIAILSDPTNFHTQKWSTALAAAGAEISVISYNEGHIPGVNCIRIPFKGKFSYLNYLQGGKELLRVLKQEKIDLLNPMNITPFGVWATKSGFHPVIQSAMGADILEFPPKLSQSPILKARSWDNAEGRSISTQGLKYRAKRRFYRNQVKEALMAANMITGDNQYLLDKMQEWFGVPEEKMKLLRWGVEPELFKTSEVQEQALRKQFGIEPNQHVVLSPRGARAIYQGDIILEAFERMLIAGCKAKLIMFSAGYEVSGSINEKAKSLESRFRNFMFVREQLPRETVYQFWNLVDVFISAPVYDGYSAALAEGRYIGAIPIINNIPANTELIQHQVNGWICDPFDAETLSTDILSVLRDIQAYKKTFSASNRNWIEANSLLTESAKSFILWANELIR